MRSNGEGFSNFHSGRSVLLHLLFAFQDFKSFIHGFGLLHVGIFKMFCDDEFLPQGTLISSIPAASDFLRRVGDGLDGSLNGCLFLAQGMETVVDNGEFLPREILPADVFVEFRFLRSEWVELTKSDEWDVTFGDLLPVE
jgi:hypothetical protein